MWSNKRCNRERGCARLQNFERMMAWINCLTQTDIVDQTIGETSRTCGQMGSASHEQLADGTL
jgi:hypothetical protein